jgi:uncharacterized membrane protein YphA (DoxX/SURF4 family)
MSLANQRRWAWAATDWVLRAGLAGVFLTAGILKLQDPAGFAAQVTSYDLFPRLSNFVAMTVPSTELVGAVALVALPPAWRRASALLLTILLVGFTCAVLWAWGSGVQVDCGCFGDNSPEVGPLPVARNMALIVLGAAILWVDRRRARSQQNSPAQ